MKYLFTLSFCLYIFLLIFPNRNIHSQASIQWNSTYNGAANDTDIVTCIIADVQGNVYVSGFSKGSTTGKDIATIKYNSSGSRVWATRYNNNATNSDEKANAITVDLSGNIIVTGYSTGTGSFKDFITIKYSPDGNILWTKEYNGKGNDDDIAVAVSTDVSGNILVTGYSVGFNTSEDYLTLKYSSDGNQLWINSYNNSEMDDIDIATSMTLDVSGNIYVTGYSIGSGSAEDFATVKYNSSGAEQWVRRYNGPGNQYDISSSIVVDVFNNVCITGYSLGIDSQEDYATIKYDPDGNVIWINRYNGNSNSYDISTALATDVNGNIFVTGYSYNNGSSEDYATIKYSPEGNQEWVSIYNGLANDYDIATSIKADNNGGVYVTGYSYNFNEEENFATIKYDNSGVRQWEEIFNNPQNGSDISAALALDQEGNIFVCGFSFDGASSVDYNTVKYSQSVGINLISDIIPAGFNLIQNFPNPFNPSTKIRFELTGDKRSNGSDITLSIYNIQGKLVTKHYEYNLQPGSYEYSFDGYNLSGGVYFYTLQSGRFSQTKKMLLLK